MSSVAVSIVTYNSAAVIADCLRSLPRDVTVYVTDNNSTDNTVDIVQHECPDAIITASPENMGFGCAHNNNIAQTSADYILVLNPDTVLYPDCLQQLLDAAKHYPDAGMIGALHEKANGQYSACFRNDFNYYPHLARSRKNYNPKADGSVILPDAAVCVEQITGALMLITRAALKAVNGFNSRLFMYFEDDDLCTRVRQAGYTIVLAPQARVVHYEGLSSGVSYRVQRIKGYHFERSRKIVHADYYGRGGSYYALIATGFIRCLSRALKCTLKGEMPRAVYYLAGCGGLLAHR
jgi:N-acetylglucosaminyl-diphospho-decaprenol L-rhamnosyltransferase